MLAIEPPIRENDLVHSQNAVLERTEEIIALSRTPFSSVEPINRGFFLRLNTPLSARFLDWWKSFPIKGRHLWADSAETDLLGTLVFLSHEFIDPAPVNPFHRPIKKPFGTYAVVCSYRHAARATAYLCREHLGPALLTAYGPSDLFSMTCERIIGALELTEGSFNSLSLPHYCPTQWGTLLRIDYDNVGRVLDYFYAVKPPDCSLPVVDDLGGLITAGFAFNSNSERDALRVALCPQANEALAIHDLGRWLRARSSPKAKKELIKA